MARPKRIVSMEDNKIVSDNQCVTPLDITKSLLPNKDLFRVDEVADYFSVSTRCIYLWIEHGHFTVERINGITRISRESILKCRFAAKGV